MMQPPDHGQGEGALVIQNFRHPRAASDEWFKITTRQTALFHDPGRKVDPVTMLNLFPAMLNTTIANDAGIAKM